MAIQFHSEAIVLKNMDYQEADKLVSVFSAVRGKIQVVARGVKKPGSSLRALVQPFCHVQLYLVKGRSMAVVTQGRMIDFYGNIRQDLFTAMQAVYMMECWIKPSWRMRCLCRLFYSTHQVLRAMNEGCVTLCCCAILRCACWLNWAILRFWTAVLTVVQKRSVQACSNSLQAACCARNAPGRKTVLLR